MLIDYSRKITEKVIDNHIDKWHNGESGGEHLHEYLNMTWDEYTTWVNNPNEIPEWIKTHNNKLNKA